MWDTGERSADTLKKAMTKLISAEPLADIDYISVADTDTLQEIEGNAAGGVLVSMAVRFGKTRLIDNIILQ